jgi:hypothetical protein
MHFVESRPGVIRSISQRWLLNHWIRIRADKVLPAWQGLEAEELLMKLPALKADFGICAVINQA